MAEQTYSIEFDGYWREPNKGGIPDKSGVYCVYTCVYNIQKDTVDIKKLVYIGESDDARKRTSNHEKQKDWEKHLNPGEQLCYSFGPVPSASRVRCEAALIFKHKPPRPPENTKDKPATNTEYKNTFPFDKTTMSLSGKTAMLEASFTVERKDT